MYHNVRVVQTDKDLLNHITHDAYQNEIEALQYIELNSFKRTKASTFVRLGQTIFVLLNFFGRPVITGALFFVISQNAFYGTFNFQFTCESQR